MYTWAPGKRTRVQSEPAPSDCVWPLEFDRFREGQNPPMSEIGLCTNLCKGSLDDRRTTRLGNRSIIPSLRPTRSSASSGAVKLCNIACHFAVVWAPAVNVPFSCQVPKFDRLALTSSRRVVLQWTNVLYIFKKLYPTLFALWRQT